MEGNWLLVRMQSAHRPKHSVESALIKVHNDILLEFDQSRGDTGSAWQLRRIWHAWPWSPATVPGEWYGDNRSGTQLVPLIPWWPISESCSTMSFLILSEWDMVHLNDLSWDRRHLSWSCDPVIQPLMKAACEAVETSGLLPCWLVVTNSYSTWEKFTRHSLAIRYLVSFAERWRGEWMLKYTDLDYLVETGDKSKEKLFWLKLVKKINQNKKINNLPYRQVELQCYSTRSLFSHHWWVGECPTLLHRPTHRQC